MKIRNLVFSIGWNFGSIDRNGKKIILESLNDSITIWFLFDWSKRAFDQSKGTLNRSKLEKTEFSAEFSSDYSKSLKRFQALWMVLWNILTLHTCLLMKYNPIELLSVEPNNLVVSWEQICDNPLATKVWGKYCLRITILYLQVIYLCLSFVLSLFFL